MTGALRDAAKLAQAALTAGKQVDVDGDVPPRPPRPVWRRDDVTGLVGTGSERAGRRARTIAAPNGEQA